LNLHSRPTPGAEYPAENPIHPQLLPIGSVAGVVAQKVLTSPHNKVGNFGTRSPSGAQNPAEVRTFIDTAKEEPAPHGTAEAFLAPLLSEAVDHQLQAIISLDVPWDTVHVDIDGSLTRVTRSSLLKVTERIRKLRVSSHIRVHLGSAAFVESATLSGLRTDLEAIVRRAGDRPGHGRVSLETRSREIAATTRHARTGITLRPARLDDFTKVDLLTASDFLFAWLDDAHGCPGTDVSAMLALYEHIGQEISRRTSTRPI
jgi:hypothetical protein